MGRFTAALVNGIETGAADSEYRGEVRFSDLRRYLGHAVTGQTPQFYDIRASGDPLISFSPATAAALLDPEVLADLDAAQWHRRRGAVAALFDVLRDGNAAARAAAKAALEGRLTQERDYLVRAEVESALHLESVASPQVGSPIAPVLAAALEEDEPSAEQPSDFDPEAARPCVFCPRRARGRARARAVSRGRAYRQTAAHSARSRGWD